MSENPMDAASRHHYEGAKLLSRGQHKAAAAEFRKAIALGAPSGDAHALLGAALHRMGKTEEALASFRAGLQRGVSVDLLEHGVLHMFLRSLMQCGCYAEALEFLKEWEKQGLVRSLLPDAAVFRGRCLWMLARYDEALLEFKKAVEEVPGEILGWMGLAEMAAKCGDIAAVERAYAAVQEMLSRAAGGVEAEEIKGALSGMEDLRRELGLQPPAPDSR